MTTHTPDPAARPKPTPLPEGPDLGDLALPRILYRGPDDHHHRPSPHAAVPLGDVLAEAAETDRLIREDEARRAWVTETVRVETVEDLEAKLADGWRLRRATAPATGGAPRGAGPREDARPDAPDGPDTPPKPGGGRRPER